MSKKILLIKILPVIAVMILMGAGCDFLGGNNQLPDGGVYKTIDGGTAWVAANPVPTASGIHSLSTTNMLLLSGDPHHAGTVYAGSAGGGLFVSNNGAGEWRKLANLGQTAIVRAVTVDPIEPCMLYVSIGHRIMKSRDCGRIWKPVYDVPKVEQQVRAIAIAPNNRAKIYAGLSDGVLVVSQNAGESWAVANRFESFIRDIAIEPKNPSRMYVVTEKKGMWRSNDGGATWEELRDQLRAFTGSQRGWKLLLDPTRDNTMIYASTFGLLRSSDGGDNWQSIKLITAPGEAKIYAVALNPQNTLEMYYSAVIGGKPLLYKTTDGGVNWKTIKLPTTRVPVSLYLRSDRPNEVLVGMYQPQK